MATNNNQYTATIQINTARAQAEIKQLNTDLADLKQRLQAAIAAGDTKEQSKLTRAINSTEKDIRKVTAASQQAAAALRAVDKATPKSLQTTIKDLNRTINSGAVQRGSKEWDALNEAIRGARAELSNIREEQQAAAESVGTPATAMREAWSKVGTALATVTGTLRTVQSAVNEYAQLQAHMANVTKYSGLTADAVDDLNESLARMDTRTSQAALNDLAADAGRLGLQSKEDILAFVEAADQINVALGEDLGEGAVKNIGKLAEMFGEVQRIGLKEAMLATGSVINELAQTSSASEGYIMEFTNRLAGMANQAGLTQAQIMAFAAVMDQNSVNVEKGATALQNVITSLFQNPAKYAAAAGLEVQAFTNLLKTDANEAVLAFLSALQNAGSMDTLAPMLKEMGLTGAGVTQTLTTLARTVDDVRTTQQQATAAYAEATSVTAEFNAANTTVEARLEKAQKGWAALRVELGRQLLPVMESGLGTANSFIPLLSTLIGFAGRHLTAIAAVTAAVVAYNVAEKAGNALKATATALEAAYTAAKTKAADMARSLTRQQLALNAAVNAAGGPWAVAIKLVTTAAAAIGTWLVLKKSQTAATEAQTAAAKANNDITAKQIQTAAPQIAQIEQLTRRVEDNTLSLGERRQALEALRRIVPEYHAELTEEGRLLNNNTGALAAYIAQLKQKAQAQAAADLLQGSATTGVSLTMQLEGWERGLRIYEAKLRAVEKQNADAIAQYRNAVATPSGGIAAQGIADSNAGVRAWIELTNKVKEHRRVVDSLRASIKANAQEQERLATAAGKAATAVFANTGTAPTPGTGQREPARVPTPPAGTTARTGGETATQATGTAGTPTAEKAAARQSEDIEQQLNRDLLALRIQYQAAHEISYTEYVDRMRALQLDALGARMALFDADSTEYLSLYNQRLDIEKQIQAEAMQVSEHEIEVNLAAQKDVIEQSHTDGQLSEAAYQQALTDLTREGLRQRITLYNKYGQDQKAAAARQKLSALDAKTQAAPAATAGADTAGTGTRTVNRQLAAVASLSNAYQNLGEKIKAGKASWEDYAAAGLKATEDITSSLSTLSNYYSTQSQYEVTMTEKKYDAQIKAAGANTKKGKKLEEEKQKEVAKIKTKYNKKQMVIEIAQATVQVAMNALKAYTAMADIPVVGPALGAVAAAAAIALGAVQIASIKKAHATEQAGYYEGGYTGGTNYRRRAGIVHEGEFVANHQAVNNPALAPVLDLIDYAQRTNRVSSLTADQVSSTLSAPVRTAASTTAAAALIPAQTTTDAATAAALDRLSDRLEQGTLATVAIDGPNGLSRQWNKYNNLKSHK